MERILVVNFSKDNYITISSMLNDLYSVTETENSTEAINVIENQEEEFSLILLGIEMEENDSYRLLAYMNKSHRIDDLPVIVISEDNSHKAVVKAYDMGAVDYLRYPFDERLVKMRIKNIISLYKKQKNLADLAVDEIFDRINNYDRMLSILSQIVEFRNEESGMHVLNVRQITETIGKRLIKKTDKYCLTAANINMIGIASSLHDIGKIVLPDNILNKPGKLTQNEYSIVKTHAMQGALMLRRLKTFKDDPLVITAYEICRWHHERYDGKGYTDGLVGDEIPISAQLVSIADVYDALTGERCYKQPYSHEKAMQMILNGECGAFNPLLLECMEEAKDELDDLLNEKPSDKNKKLDILKEEVSRHGELSVSNRLLQGLKFEQERANYFENAVNKITFVYKHDPSMLVMSKENAKRFGLKEITPKPDADESVLGGSGISREEWLSGTDRFSPQNPDFTLEGKFTVDGQRKRCSCRCHSIWSSQEEYLGVVGIITVSEEEE